MYTKEQAAKIRQKFWTLFGQYMKPVAGAGGEKVNWLNYKTGIPNLFFRLDAGSKTASVQIELRQATEAERLRYYNHFTALKNLMEETTGFKWNWQPSATDEHGLVISAISRTLPQVNVLNESDWPAIIAFLKSGIMALDQCWDMVKDSFD